MYYGKKKGIIIAISAGVTILVLIIIAIVILTTTDLFKSNKTLFWKYAQGLYNKDEGITTSQLQDLIKMMEQNPYTTKGKVIVNYSDGEDEKEIANLQINSENDKLSDYSHVDFKLNSFNQNMLNVDYVQSKNKYALKSDEIVTAYVGVKNENLKVLTQKFGLTDTTNIPDELSESTFKLSDLFEITENEKQHILETYSEVVVNNIPESNYSKLTESTIVKNGQTYTTTAYRLDLSAQEIKTIASKVFQMLKTDSITLNLISSKLKLLGLDEDKASIEEIKNYIDDIITLINDTELTDMSFTVYNYKGENIATEILIKNMQKYTIYKDTNSITIQNNDLSGNSSVVKTIQINYQSKSTQTSANIKYLEDNEEKINISISNIGTVSNGNIETNLDISVLLRNDETYTISYNQNLEFVDNIDNKIELNATNSVMLNDYTKEQLSSLITALTQRIQAVYNEKMQLFYNLSSMNANSVKSRTTNNDNNTNLNNELVNNYNSRFEKYKGNITGAQLKTLKLTVESNNDSADTDNTIKMYIDNIETNENTNVDTNSNYSVQMEYGSNGFINKIVANKI